MYRMILISADGMDCVSDFRGSLTAEDASQSWGDSGSKWFFYPYGVVVADDGERYRDAIIVECPMYGPLAWFPIGSPVSAIMAEIAENRAEYDAFYFPSWSEVTA